MCFSDTVKSKSFATVCEVLLDLAPHTYLFSLLKTQFTDLEISRRQKIFRHCRNSLSYFCRRLSPTRYAYGRGDHRVLILKVLQQLKTTINRIDEGRLIFLVTNWMIDLSEKEGRASHQYSEPLHKEPMLNLGHP